MGFGEESGRHNLFMRPSDLQRLQIATSSFTDCREKPLSELFRADGTTTAVRTQGADCGTALTILSRYVGMAGAGGRNDRDLSGGMDVVLTCCHDIQL